VSHLSNVIIRFTSLIHLIGVTPIKLGFLGIGVFTCGLRDHLITRFTSLIQVQCCDVAVAQINYPSFKHNTQDSIEQARGRSHEEDSSQIFMLDDMQFRGGLDVI
jgi:hypothetical protein